MANAVEAVGEAVDEEVRVNVPRDMSIYAAKRLRESLEKTAALVGDRQSPPLPTKHRRDQDPHSFKLISGDSALP